MSEEIAPIASLDEARAALDAEIARLNREAVGRSGAQAFGGYHPRQRPVVDAVAEVADRHLAMLRSMRERMGPA